MTRTPGLPRILADEPSLVPSLGPGDHSHLAHAIFRERFDAAELMLRVGFDPAAADVDGGTALHAACWTDSVRLVERILGRGRVPVDARDPTHHSTPLGWAASDPCIVARRAGTTPEWSPGW